MGGRSKVTDNRWVYFFFDLPLRSTAFAMGVGSFLEAARIAALSLVFWGVRDRLLIAWPAKT
jgi:hypothetical protein